MSANRPSGLMSADNMRSHLVSTPNQNNRDGRKVSDSNVNVANQQQDANVTANAGRSPVAAPQSQAQVNTPKPHGRRNGNRTFAKPPKSAYKSQPDRRNTQGVSNSAANGPRSDNIIVAANASNVNTVHVSQETNIAQSSTTGIQASVSPNIDPTHKAAHKQDSVVGGADSNTATPRAPNQASAPAHTSPTSTTIVNNTVASQDQPSQDNVITDDSPPAPHQSSPLAPNPDSPTVVNNTSSSQDQSSKDKSNASSKPAQSSDDQQSSPEIGVWRENGAPVFHRRKRKNRKRERNTHWPPIDRPAETLRWPDISYPNQQTPPKPKLTPEEQKEKQALLREKMKLYPGCFEPDSDDEREREEERKKAEKEAFERQFTDNQSVIFDPVLPRHAVIPADEPVRPKAAVNGDDGAIVVTDDQQMFPTPAEAVKMEKEYAAKIKEMPKPTPQAISAPLPYTVPRFGGPGMPRIKLQPFFHGEKNFKDVFALLRSREKLNPAREDLNTHLCRERDALQALAAERNEIVTVGKQMSTGPNKYTLPPIHNTRSRESPETVSRWLWFHRKLELGDGRRTVLKQQFGSSDVKFLAIQTADKYKILSKETLDRIEDWTYEVVTNLTRNPYSVDVTNERWQWGLTLEWGMRHCYQELPPDYIFGEHIRLDYEEPDWSQIRALKNYKLYKISRWDQTANMAMEEEMKHQQRLADARRVPVAPKKISDREDLGAYRNVPRIRPALPKDLPEIREIWNWHIRETFNTGHNQELTMDNIKRIAVDVANRKWPFLVTIERVYDGPVFGQDERPGHEWHVQLLPEDQRGKMIAEVVTGFVVSREFQPDQSSFDAIPKLELYVHHEHMKKQLGIRLINKALSVMTDQANDTFKDLCQDKRLHESEAFKRKTYPKVDKVVVQLYFENNFAQLKAREEFLTKHFGFVTAGMFSNWCININKLKYSMILMHRDTHEQKQRERLVSPPRRRSGWLTREEDRELRRPRR